ncbi:BrnA antitoxin family protein [soil metagenome]
MRDASLKPHRKRRLEEAEAAIAAIRDEDIDLSDIPEITEEQWSRAVRNPYFRPVKDQVTLRIDRDVLAWFRHTEEKYQTAINAALREHVERHRKAS